MVDVKNDEAGDDQHYEECYNFESNIALLLQCKSHSFRVSCDFSSVFGNRFNNQGLCILAAHLTCTPITYVCYFDRRLVSGIIYELIMWNTLVVLRCCLSRDLLLSQVELEIEVRKHFFIFASCIWEHGFKLCLVLQSRL